MTNYYLFKSFLLHSSHFTLQSLLREKHDKIFSIGWNNQDGKSCNLHIIAEICSLWYLSVCKLPNVMLFTWNEAADIWHIFCEKQCFMRSCNSGQLISTAEGWKSKHLCREWLYHSSILSHNISVNFATLWWKSHNWLAKTRDKKNEKFRVGSQYIVRKCWQEWK